MNANQTVEFEDKFIAFVDVLGFKAMVEAAEQGSGRTLSEIQEILGELGYQKDRDFIRTSGPKTCPGSPRVRNDLAFEVTQVSDCVIVSAEISPAGLINLVSHCWGAAIELLMKGIMVRGYITRGKIFHKDQQFLGTGYHAAYGREGSVEAFKIETDEKGTPFVEVDKEVIEYVDHCDDWCTKEMFGRMVKSDGSVAALFPFQSLSHSFLIAGNGVSFVPETERRSNDNLRKLIYNLKDRVMKHVDLTNGAALKKTRHYIAGYGDSALNYPHVRPFV